MNKETIKEKILQKTKLHPLYKPTNKKCGNLDCQGIVWELYRLGLYGWPYLCLKCGWEMTFYDSTSRNWEESENEGRKWRLEIQATRDRILKEQGIL